MTKANLRGVLFGVAAGALVLGTGATGALAQETVRIGLATKTWFPTVVAEAALQQGFFKKEGINAELTVYQSGAETFTSLAAGSADVVSTSPNIIATGRVRGVNAKMVLKGSSGNLGWQLIVPTKS